MPINTWGNTFLDDDAPMTQHHDPYLVNNVQLTTNILTMVTAEATPRRLDETDEMLRTRRNLERLAAMPVTPITNDARCIIGNGGKAKRVHGLETGIVAEHPLTFLANLAKELNITSFTFARYATGKNQKDTYNEPIAETQTILSNPMPRIGGDLNKAFLEYVCSKDIVALNQEIAIQSIVQLNGTDYFHIPMIDFVYEDLKIIKEAMDYSSDLIDMDSGDFEFYSSGNSYHAYGNLLIPESDWPEYTSKLLLIKHPKSVKNIVDSRWVAHSQLKKSFSLRLTRVGKSQLPILMK